MYAINQVGRAVLITPLEALNKISTNNNLDSGKLLPAIEIAELRFLGDYECMGMDFYEAMCTEKNRTVTSGNIVALQAAFDAQYPDGNGPVLVVGMVVNASEFLSADNLALWNAILWKYVAECVLYTALPENYLDFSSAGLMKNNPISSAVAQETSKAVGASLSDIKFVMQKWMTERIEPLRAGLKRYMQANASKYPKWWMYNRAPERNSAYVDLSIYRDQDAGEQGCVWRGNNPGRNPNNSGCCD